MRFSRHILAALPLLTSAAAGATDLPNYNIAAVQAASRTSAAFVTRAATVSSRGSLAFPTSIDERRGVPTLLWAARSNSPAPGGSSREHAALFHLQEHAARYHLSDAALDTAEVTQVHDTGRGGILVVLRQRANGIELFHSDVKVLMNRGHELVAIGGNLHPSAVRDKMAGGFHQLETQAVSNALHDLYGLTLPTEALVDTKKVKGGYHYIELKSAAAANNLRFTSPARVKRVWFPMPDRLIPGYAVVLLVGHGTGGPSDAYQYVFGADDGRLLYRENLTHSDSFQYRVWAETDADHRPKDGPIGDFTPHPTGIPDGSYPEYTAPSLVSIEGLNEIHDPWLPPGATESRGNNVDAYTDDDAPDGFSAKDTRASVTAPGVFDRVFDTGVGPQSSTAQKMAAVTQIFYVTNWLHDFWYDSGFDEAAGNAQKDNYGRGGLDGDPLHAEAQDGAPQQRNNADMSALPDGDSPRMQMFIWDGRSKSTFNVQPLNKDFSFGIAEFSPVVFDVSSSLAVVDDGSAPSSDACQSIVNDVSGRIAVIDRGTCTFKSKALRAATAGALGVVLVDNQSSPTPPQMGDGDPLGPLTIPVVSVTLASGNAIKAAILGGAATAKLSRQGEPDRDGTIDNTIVAHEWGHYIHLRQVACGSPACSAESEGWGDFFALHMLVRKGDDLDGTFGLSQYATASFPDDPAYFGIRRYPYSVDFMKNALTFKHITSGEPLPAGVPVASYAASGADNAESHAAGEIWASMLFEAYIALLKRSQTPNPPYSFEDARRRMADYVEAGLKLAPTDPTFTEQRDAILAAAAASDLADVEAMAAAFARRGAGTCAVSPARDSFDFQGVVESFTVEPNLAIMSLGIDDKVKACDTDGHLDAGETGKLTIEVMNKGTAPVVGATATVTSALQGAEFPGGSKVAFGDIAPFTSAKASIDVSLSPTLKTMANLDLQVKLDNAGSCATEDTLHTAPLVNYDELSGASTTDTVEPAQTAWQRDGDNADAIWARTEPTPGQHVWSGVDFPSPSDTALLSPALLVSTTDKLILTFEHRHLFEESKGTTWDGSVIEVSTDGGGTWEDISKYGDPGYEGEIGDPAGQAKNALMGRAGYVGRNASWPAMQAVKVDMGTALAGKTIRVRFRIGTDDAAGDFGWELDNIGFQGITNKPFAAVVDKVSGCIAPEPKEAGPDVVEAGPAVSEAGPTVADSMEAIGGGGCDCATSGSGTGAGFATSLSALAVLLRSRRRRRTGVRS